MYVDGDRIERESIGELFGRAVDEGKTLATAKADVVKKTALDKVDKAKVGVGLIVVGGLLAYAAVIVLLIAVFLWLLGELGPIGAGLIVAGVTLVAAFILVKVGASKLSAMSANGELK